MPGAQSSRAKHSIKLPITEALVSSPMAVNSRIDLRDTLHQRSVAGASQSSEQMSRYMAQMARIASELEATTRPQTELTKGRITEASRYCNVYRLAEQANAWSSNHAEDFQALMVNTHSGPRLHGGRPS